MIVSQILAVGTLVEIDAVTDSQNEGDTSVHLVDSIEKIKTDLPSDIIKNRDESFPSNSDNNSRLLFLNYEKLFE